MKPHRTLAILAVLAAYPFHAYARQGEQISLQDRLRWTVAQKDASDFSDQGTASLPNPLIPSGTDEGTTPTRTVNVTGTGASAEEAQRDAARLAVQQIVGLYVDARRQVESKITDKDVSDTVQEKILSYTNAYITKMKVTKTDRKNGLIVVDADVTVRVAPLVKVLKDARIPTVAFDTATAIGQVEVSAREKASAIDLYADLLRRGDDLITLGVGSPKVDTGLQAPTDQSWLSVPITFKANDEAIKDWRSKFELIATQRARFDVPISQARLNGSAPDRSCSVPVFDTSFALNNGVTEQTFTGTVTPDDEHGVVACFETAAGSTTATLECFGRRFLDNARLPPGACNGASCLSLKGKTPSMGMRIELIDASGSVIHTIPVSFVSFPMLNIFASRTEPRPGFPGSFNYCAPDQQPFYALAPRDAAYGDVLILPAPGSRVRAHGNFLLPNAVITRTASLRISVINNDKGAQR